MATGSGIPFNLDLLMLDSKLVAGITPVTVIDRFEGKTRQIHNKGLYSVEIFGPVGSPERDTRMSYIDIRIPIFHPLIYRTLLKMKKLYSGIISGTHYAVWDSTISDFRLSNQSNEEANTGFHFFVSHWADIVFTETESDERSTNIKLIEKFKSSALQHRIVVMPAGMREMQDDGTRIQEDEINKIYMRLIGIGNSISLHTLEANPELLNTNRASLQRSFNELYDYLQAMTEGKKKLMQNKWAGRNILNSTRNVVTAATSTQLRLGDKTSAGYNDTTIGLYQALKAILPVAIHAIKNSFLKDVFIEQTQPVNLVNKVTFKADPAMQPQEVWNRWSSNEGIENMINLFGDERMRHNPMEVNGRFLALLYRGPDGTFKVIHGIDELPNPEEQRQFVKPITFVEFLYIATYEVINKSPAFITRYPITGVGSIYPSNIFVKTTTQSECLVPLDDNWEKISDKKAVSFPVQGKEFVNSMTPSVARVLGMGMDFDGDTGSLTATYSDESIATINAYLGSKRAYIGTDGRLLASINMDTLQFVAHNLTKD